MHSTPYTRAIVALALLVTIALAVGRAQARPMPGPDVRQSSSWSVVIAPNHTRHMPASVCRGYLPSDYEAWSLRTGKRVGDDRLSVNRTRRTITSHYRGTVRVFVWCEQD
jgi:hypothetical protein